MVSVSAEASTHEEHSSSNYLSESTNINLQQLAVQLGQAVKKIVRLEKDNNNLKEHINSINNKVEQINQFDAQDYFKLNKHDKRLQMQESAVIEIKKKYICWKL